MEDSQVFHPSQADKDVCGVGRYLDISMNGKDAMTGSVQSRSNSQALITLTIPPVRSISAPQV